ncbi:immunoglobulin domain protein [Ancylostoma caninum]|uniref:Immunoglobulin domain protein n=1 Tax=Ancylostoma caninum TaxID=29170 RepID=A0A368H5L6_ANCCA|nr:immunoglobulin domain protein [Ancylostoma caninum]
MASYSVEICLSTVSPNFERYCHFNSIRNSPQLSAPPVLRLPTGSMFHEVPGARPPKVIGGVRTVKKGGSLELRCPVFAYPQAWVRWERDGTAIEPNPSISYDGDNVILTHVDANMAGTYTCIADNSFPMFVDGPSMPHQLIFEQKVSVNP